jgi:hypothetical protein
MVAHRRNIRPECPGHPSAHRYRDPASTASLPLASILVSCRLLVGASFLLVGGCGGGKLGSFDTPEPAGPSNKLAELFGFAKDRNAPSEGPQSRRISCPEIVVLDGTGVARFHAGSPPSNENLRVQYSIEDTARECSIKDDKLVLKVGISGKVLLGPAGSAGSFSVPVRVAIVRNGDQSAVASKLFRTPATIAARRTEESFTIVSEPIVVPFIHDRADEDYTIKVGIDSAGS